MSVSISTQRCVSVPIVHFLLYVAFGAIERFLVDLCSIDALLPQDRVKVILAFVPTKLLPTVGGVEEPVQSFPQGIFSCMLELSMVLTHAVDASLSKQTRVLIHSSANSLIS